MRLTAAQENLGFKKLYNLASRQAALELEVLTTMWVDSAVLTFR